MSWRMMGRLGWMVAFIDVSLLLGPSHLLTPLFVSASFLHSTLILKAMSIRRAAVRVSGRSRWTSVSHVVHA
jgi:hypothetical protein